MHDTKRPKASFCIATSLATMSAMLLASSIAVRSQTLHISAPDGGERFLVGSTTTIRWDGIAATDTVTLEYSTDAGTSWTLITDRARGLQHTWAPIPNTPSTQCLLRATKRASIGDSVLYLRATRPGFAIPDAVHFAEFSPDGSRVIGGGASGDLFVWDAASGALLSVVPVESGTFPSQPGITRISSARYSPDGNLIATLSPIDARAGAVVRLFDAITLQKVGEWTRDDVVGVSTSEQCAFSRDGTALLVTGLGGGIVYGVAGGARITQLQGYTGPSNTSSMVDGDWTSDGTRIIGASIPVTGAIPEFILSDAASGSNVRAYAYGFNASITSVRMRPGNAQFISASFDRHVRVHDVATGAIVHDIVDFAQSANWAQYSNSGTTFATAGQDNGSPNWKLRLYDASSGAFIREIAAIVNGIRNLDYSPDDSRLLVSCIDGVRIFYSPTASPAQTDRSDSLWEIYRTTGAIVNVRAGAVSARQGEEVMVPISIDDPQAALGGGATRVDLDMRFNVTLLEPFGATPAGTFDARDRTIKLSFPITADTLLGLVRLRAALGSDSTSALDLSNAATDVPSAAVAVIENDGLFRLRDLCFEGGVRLLNPNGSVVLRVVATSVVNGTVEVEVGTIESTPATLTLYNLDGSTVGTWREEHPPSQRWRRTLEIGSIASGRYLLVLRAGHVEKNAMIEVVK